MKLIHCADFHLDAPMRTHLLPESAKLRRNELLQTFGRMAEYAHAQGVSAVLIAGDLFDSPSPRREVVRYVTDTVEKYPDIHFYYLRGNHDAGIMLAHVPENLHLFSDAWQHFRCGDVTIYGAENCRTGTDYDGLDPDPAGCNIVLLHGQPGSAAGEDVVPLTTLRGRGIDYLALGHIHTYQSGSLDSRGNWVCAGCPEGRGFDETGEKGFVLLDVRYKQVSARFVPFAFRTLHRCSVDISDAETLVQQSERIAQAVDGLPEQHMVDLVLTGEVPPGQTPDTDFLQQQLAPRFFLARVTDNTRLAIDRAHYRSELSLKGTFFRLTEGDPDLSPEDQDFVLRTGFAALDGDPIHL